MDKFSGVLAKPDNLRLLAVAAKQNVLAQVEAGRWHWCETSDPGLFSKLKCSVDQVNGKLFFRWSFAETPLQFLCTWNISGDTEV